MGKVWRFNPFYWIARHKMHFSCENKAKLPTMWRNLNPFRWSKRAIRVFTVGFFMIMLPVYVFIGMQPAASINTEGLPTLSISSIRLNTPVSPLELNNRELIAPANIAGSYTNSKNKIFIIGHSSTVFRRLADVETGDLLEFDGATYQVVERQILAKADISMSTILAASPIPTIIIMTCAGESLPNQDATHRLILTAEITQ